jgi:hypothetical protein
MGFGPTFTNLAKANMILSLPPRPKGDGNRRMKMFCIKKNQGAVYLLNKDKTPSGTVFIVEYSQNAEQRCSVQACDARKA